MGSKCEFPVDTKNNFTMATNEKQSVDEDVTLSNVAHKINNNIIPLILVTNHTVGNQQIKFASKIRWEKIEQLQSINEVADKSDWRVLFLFQLPLNGQIRCGKCVDCLHKCS